MAIRDTISASAWLERLNRSRAALIGLVALGFLVPLGLLVSSRSAASEFSAAQELGTNRVATATVDLVAGRVVATAAEGLVAPGARQFMEVVASNAGSLPLLVTVTLEPDDSPVSKALTWEYWDGDCENRPAPEDVNRPPTSLPSESVDPGLEASVTERVRGVPLATGDERTVCVAAVLPLDIPNELQGESASYHVVFHGVHDIDRS